MNYKELFEKLNITNLDFKFCMANEMYNKIDKEDYEFLNNLAFSPVDAESKKKVFEDLYNNKLSNKDAILKKIYRFYDEFYNRFNSKRILIRELTKYVFDWIKINNIQIDLIKQNIINVENKIFVFYIVHKFYNEHLYEDTVVLIDYLFSKQYFTKENEFYNDLLLYKLISLKNEYEYLDNDKVFNEVCKIAQNLYGFEYIRIITLLECKLKQNNISEFEEILNKYFNRIKEWEVYEVLNLYELTIYTRNKSCIQKVEQLLNNKDIEIFLLFDDEYSLIYNFFNSSEK